MFGAVWCKNCTILEQKLKERNIFSLVSIFKVDVEDFPTLADEFDISSLPTTIFFQGGSILARFSGSDIDLFESIVVNRNQPSLLVEEAIEPLVPVSMSLDRLLNPIIVPRMSCFESFHDISYSFLCQIGLEDIMFAPKEFISLSSCVKDALDAKFPVEDLSLSMVNQLYCFQVPTIGPDGSCSNLSKMAKRPFNLAVDAYGFLTEDSSNRGTGELSESDLQRLLLDSNTERLLRLKYVVDELYSLTMADWIGIYRVVSVTFENSCSGTHDEELSLLKESYRGEPSRALFPLTEAFAKKSTNSWVAMNGKCRLIQNTNQLADGVGYYKCSGKVQSELCVPILKWIPDRQIYEVLGIIDLESWNAHHFNGNRILQVVKIANDLGDVDLFCH